MVLPPADTQTAEEAKEAMADIDKFELTVNRSNCQRPDST
jgi:hypothetical protein